MDQIRPEDEQHDSVYESTLSKMMGFLQNRKFEELHDEPLHCPKLIEEGNPKFYRVTTVKRRGFSLAAISKEYELPRNRIIMDDVRAGNDVQARCLVDPNGFMLTVYDCSRYCVIYEYYLYNLEEVCELQIRNHNVRPTLKKSIVDSVKTKQFVIVKSDGYRTTTQFFRDFMKHTLKFLEYLHVRKRAYGGLHPHNILIVDEECLIKFRGLKDVKSLKNDAAVDQDLHDFVRLVRFCAHGGGRNIENTNNDEDICKEAKEFLSIFVLDQNGNCHRHRSYYAKGFLKNRLNILKHPLFWDESMCMNYFLQTHAVLVACKLTWKKYDFSHNMRVFQQNLDPSVAKARIDLLAVNVECSYRHLQGNVIDDILAMIRNMEGHYPDGLDGRDTLMGYLGSHPDDFWNKLRDTYPGLIIGVHNVMMTYTKFISSLFKSHWEKFYPYVY